ncbi:MAG: TonB family protein [Ignavibacteriaceae bacterium]|jgi:TonB family protein
MKNTSLLFLVLFFLLISGLFAQKDTTKTFYPNGNIESVIPLDNGLREGVAKFYYENGNLKEERTFLAGKVEGEVKRFYENGKTKEIFSIIKGKRDGATTTFDSLGNYLSDVYYAEGKIQKEETGSEENLVEKTQEEQVTVKENPIVSPPIQKTEETPPVISSSEIIDSAIYRNPTIFPEPRLGYKKFYENIVYPQAAKEKKREGTVLIKAIINEYGDVEKTEIVKGIGLGCEEAAEIAVSFTRFYPGLVRGKPVKVEMVFAIAFKLAKEK